MNYILNHVINIFCCTTLPVNFFLMASLELAYIILLLSGALSGALSNRTIDRIMHFTNTNKFINPTYEDLPSAPTLIKHARKPAKPLMQC